MRVIAMFLLGLAAAAAVALAPQPAHADCSAGLGDGASAADLRRAIQCLSNRIDRLEGRNSADGTFFQAIVAFDNYACPEGWMLYEPAVGRVVVGAGQGRSAGPWVPRREGEPPKVPVPHPSAASDEVSVGQPWVTLIYCRRL